MRDIDYLKRMRLIDSWYSKISIPNESPDSFRDSTFLQEILSTDGVEHDERTEMYIDMVYMSIKDIDSYTSNIRTFKNCIDNRILPKMVYQYNETGICLRYDKDLSRFSICKNGTVDVHRKQLWFITGKRGHDILYVQYIALTTALKNHFGDVPIVVFTDYGAYALHINNNMIIDKEKLEDSDVGMITDDNTIRIDL